MDIELDNKEFQNVWRLITDTNSSIFMTGRAGTGKSTFLRYIVEHVKKKTIVLAPTGIAAVNAGGVTLHSFFKIPLQPFALDDVNYSDPRRVRDMQKFSSEKIKLLQEVELIVIDEISMVRADVLDFVDRVLRTYVRRGRMLPFGGKQMLLVGDAFQLEPVVKGQDWDILRRFYTTPYFFGARVFTSMSLVQVELRKVYRQKEAEFLSMLDKVRVGMTSPADIGAFNRRVMPDFEPTDGHMYITLTATRATCDFINDKHLKELGGDEHMFEGVINGDFPEASLPTNRQLTLKEDAQVVFVRNDMEKRWYNGTVGRIVRIEEEGVWVEVEAQDKPQEDGAAAPERYFVEPETWENVKYRYNEAAHKVESEILGTYRQLPMKLAWAITIHKSQGLTFDNVIIDLGRGAFACGQVYVALSRCRSLGGIVLRQPITLNDIKTNMFVRDFSYGANDQTLINSQLERARAQTMAADARDAFQAGDYAQAVNMLLDSLALQPEKMKDGVTRRYLAMKIGRAMGRLEAEAERLAKSERKMREKNFEFAYEYYLLAAECLHSYGDARAAKANVNKAIALAPDYADALSLRAEIEIDEGDYKQGVADLDIALRPGALKNKSKLRDAIWMRARGHAGMRNWEKAMNDLTDLASQGRPTAETLRMMADVCRHMDRGDEADMYKKLADRMEAGEDDDDDDF